MGNTSGLLYMTRIIMKKCEILQDYECATETQVSKCCWEKETDRLD